MFGVRVKSSPAVPAAPDTVAADEGSGGGGNAVSPSSSHHPPSTSSTSVAPVELARVRSGPPSGRRRVPYTILPDSTLQIYQSSPEYASAMVDALGHTAASNSLLPPWRGKVILVLAVPKSYSPEEFITFCNDHVNHTSDIHIISNDLVEDRYSALLTFKDQKGADAFYLNMNGWTFTDRGEVCHVLFVAALEFSIEIALSTPNAATELPTCPVCVERLGGIIGLTEATCDHSNLCSCFLLWANSSCAVCISQKQQEGQSCHLCQNDSGLSICMICGFIGCGRYGEGHLKSHLEETGHSYIYDLKTRKICDGNIEHATESGLGDLLRIEVEKAIEEPNCHFSRALEAQRQYYKILLTEAKGGRELSISEAVNKAVNSQRQELQLQLKNVVAEKEKATAINTKLVKSREIYESLVAQMEESTAKELESRDAEIHILNEEIEDYKGNIKLKERVRKDDSLQGASLAPSASMVPSERPNTSDSGGRGKRKGRGRKRKQ